jgi:hypothetical protein
MERRAAPLYHFMLYLFLACFNWTSIFAHGGFEPNALGEGRKLEIEKKYE